jgi:hypothetical protein
LAWVLGWALLFLVKRVRSRPQAGNEHYPQIANAEDNNEQHGKKDYFPAPWTVEPVEGGFKVIDSNGQTLAYVYGDADSRDAGIAKALTLDRGSRAASPSCPSFSPRRQQSPLSELMAKLVIFCWPRGRRQLPGPPPGLGLL